MKKVALLFVLSLAGLIYWIMEPHSYIPFNKPKSNISIKADIYQCKESLPIINRSASEAIISYIDSGALLGVSAGFYSDSCGIYSIASGVRSKSAGLPFVPDIITRVASITKPITAVAIMQLYEKGLLDLDSPIQEYLPAFPEANGIVTIRQLLNHTAGVPHYSSKLDAMSFTAYDTLEDATNKIYSRGFISPTGEKYVYSSFGYTILGRVIEQVSGQDYESYLSDNIFEKAGMSNTSLETDEWAEDKSNLYIKIASSYIKAPSTNLSIIYPAGGLQSTSEDLLKFAKAILDNKLVKRSTLEMMIDVSDSLSPAVGDDPYGLGWTVNELPEFGTVISHSGSQPGVSAFFQIFLDKNLASVALSNAFGTKSSSRNLSFAMATLESK